jgi:hypothetical protein
MRRERLWRSFVMSFVYFGPPDRLSFVTCSKSSPPILFMYLVCFPPESRETLSQRMSGRNSQQPIYLHWGHRQVLITISRATDESNRGGDPAISTSDTERRKSERGLLDRLRKEVQALTGIPAAFQSLEPLRGTTSYQQSGGSTPPPGWNLPTGGSVNYLATDEEAAEYLDRYLSGKETAVLSVRVISDPATLVRATNLFKLAHKESILSARRQIVAQLGSETAGSTTISATQVRILREEDTGSSGGVRSSVVGGERGASPPNLEVSPSRARVEESVSYVNEVQRFLALQQHRRGLV